MSSVVGLGDLTKAFSQTPALGGGFGENVAEAQVRRRAARARPGPGSAWSRH